MEEGEWVSRKKGEEWNSFEGVKRESDGRVKGEKWECGLL